MATYYDSSAVLEVLLIRPHHKEVMAYWDSDQERFSSILLEAETLVSLRRLSYQTNLAIDSPVMKGRFVELENYLQSMELQQVDEDILAILRQTPSLSNCRSLDALHLATAILFQQHLEEPLRICSLDQRLRQLAVALKFGVIPN